MGLLLQDLRCGVRTLLKNPGFTAVAVVTLALGIGANTAIFSVMNGLLLRPMPYPEPGRLVMIYWKGLDSDRGGTSYSDFIDWQREQTQSLENAALYHLEDYNFAGVGEREHLRARGRSTAS